jgi:stress-induced morphogen
MFEIYVVSDDFKGLSRVKQHQKITQALKSEIKDMHGCRIFTGTE